MGLFSTQRWINFLALLPGTVLTVVTIAVAFLCFYDEQDFSLLRLIAQPRVWSNRLAVAALLVALVNFGVEWHRRKSLTTGFANEKQTAWLRKSNADARMQHEQRLSELKRQTAELRKQNARLAELESKLDAVLPKSVSN
jgi:hypothetical protein